jgi:hypothetical protein
MPFRLPVSHQIKDTMAKRLSLEKFVLQNKFKPEQHPINSYFLEISSESAKVDVATKHRTSRTLCSFRLPDLKTDLKILKGKFW